MDKRCRSTLVSHAVGRRGVTNLVNLKESHLRLHLIPACDAATLYDAINDLQFLHVRPIKATFPGEPRPVEFFHTSACCREACHTPLILQCPACVPFWKHTFHAENTSSLSKRSSSGGSGRYFTPATQNLNIRHRASTGPSATTQLVQAFGHAGLPLIAFGL